MTHITNPRTPFVIALALAVTVTGFVLLALSFDSPAPTNSLPIVPVLSTSRLDVGTSVIDISDSSQTVPAKISWPGGKYDIAGLAFISIPRGSFVYDQSADPREFIGEAQIIRIALPGGDAPVTLVLQSGDFGIKVADGCCEWLGDVIDLRMSDADLHDALVTEFRSAWSMERFRIGERPAVGFWTAFTYGDTSLSYHVVVDTGIARRPMLHARSEAGMVASPANPLPVITDANVTALVGASARERVKSVLDTIIFYTDTAQ